jgi:hypothetical protein
MWSWNLIVNSNGCTSNYGGFDSYTLYVVIFGWIVFKFQQVKSKSKLNKRPSFYCWLWLLINSCKVRTTVLSDETAYHVNEWIMNEWINEWIDGRRKYASLLNEYVQAYISVLISTRRNNSRAMATMQLYGARAYRYIIIFRTPHNLMGVCSVSTICRGQILSGRESTDKLFLNQKFYEIVQQIRWSKR